MLWPWATLRAAGEAFIDQIPRELDDAAVVDGATLLQIVRHVIVPLSLQGMIAASTFVLIFSWSEFLFAFIFTTTEAKTAPFILSEMLGALDGVEEATRRRPSLSRRRRMWHEPEPRARVPARFGSPCGPAFELCRPRHPRAPRAWELDRWIEARPPTTGPRV